MAPARVNLAILDDDARWADNSECGDLLVAGVWFLHDTLKSRHPRCPLLGRITQLGDQLERLRSASGGDPSNVTAADASAFFTEMNTVGTLGHSLWRLKRHLDAPGLRYELSELSQLGTGENPAGDQLRLRGQGFLLFAAGHLVSQGFDVEFISRRKEQQTPDFFAIRDDNRFTCEVTNRYPETGDCTSVDFFWSTLHGVVNNKRNQLRGTEFTNGVLIIDCSPVWEAFGLSDVPIGGQLVFSIPEHLGGPRSTPAPLVRYDESPHSLGLRGLEDAIRGTNIHTLVLWNHKLEISDVGYRRRMEYRILGTVHGCEFWSYFPKVCVFPGPQLSIVWPAE
jgi:hypothetical protein